MSTQAQTFTNIVNKRINSHISSKYEFDSRLTITNPLVFFINTTDGTAEKTSATLFHGGVEYKLFSATPSSSTLFIGPFNIFDGESEGGNWELYFSTSSPLTIRSWGIVEQMPEPSALSMFLVGSVFAILFARKK